jgi:tetratricopeptide (TPR) repeat protein
MLRFLIMHVRGVAGAKAASTANGPQDPCPAEPAEATKQRSRVAGDSIQPRPPHPAKPISPAFSPPTNAGTLLLLICLSSTLVGCTCLRRKAHDAKVVSARQMSLKGIAALQRGQWDDAEALFADALHQNPTDERAHHHFAEVMWKRGQNKAAIQHMEESVRLSGGDATLLVQLGEMYLDQGDVRAAWECATEAIDANSHLAGAWALRGDVYRRQSNWDAALESYHHALSEQPHFPHVQLAAANVYREQNRPQRALATLDSLAAQYRPQETPAELFFQKGLSYKALGRYQEAVSVLTTATQPSETPADWYYHLAEAQHLAGNSASAKLALQAALTRTPDHIASLRLRDKIGRRDQSLTASVDR